MMIYMLIWSFATPYSVSGTYVETPYVFKNMESCINKLTELKLGINEGNGECMRGELK